MRWLVFFFIFYFSPSVGVGFFVWTHHRKPVERRALALLPSTRLQAVNPYRESRQHVRFDSRHHSGDASTISDAYHTPPPTRSTPHPFPTISLGILTTAENFFLATLNLGTEKNHANLPTHFNPHQTYRDLCVNFRANITNPAQILALRPVLQFSHTDFFSGKYIFFNISRAGVVVALYAGTMPSGTPWGVLARPLPTDCPGHCGGHHCKKQQKRLMGWFILSRTRQ